MDLREQKQFSMQQERNHWWIKTRWLYVDKAIELLNKPEINLLEFGCGSAQNLYYLRRLSTQRNTVKQVVGYDPLLVNPKKPDWAATSDHLINDLSVIKGQQFDLLLAMDVLEHIEDDAHALSQWLPFLKPNGVVLITVPAFQSLWSGKDIELGHKRRYTCSSLLALTAQYGLKPLYIRYAFSYLYVPMWLLKWLPSRKKQAKVLGLQSTARSLNTALYRLGQMEKTLGGNRWFGSSVVGLFKL